VNPEEEAKLQLGLCRRSVVLFPFTLRKYLSGRGPEFCWADISTRAIGAGSSPLTSPRARQILLLVRDPVR
jgi:hypothetical protein